MLLCGNHNYKKSSFDLILGNITLEDGVWLIAKSVVCNGVMCTTPTTVMLNLFQHLLNFPNPKRHCEERGNLPSSHHPTNSVATKQLEEYWVYVGNPAIKIRERIINK